MKIQTDTLAIEKMFVVIVLAAFFALILSRFRNEDIRFDLVRKSRERTLISRFEQGIGRPDGRITCAGNCVFSINTRFVPPRLPALAKNKQKHI